MSLKNRIKQLITKLITKIKDLFKKAMMSQNSAHKLALSSSIGLYIAFSPFFGGHSVMMIFFNWLLKLNFPMLFLFTSVNNPWTMIPFYTGGYFFGYWLLHVVLDIHPMWSVSLAKIFGSGNICVWSFLIGGNVLGLISAFVSYPLFKRMFTQMAARRALAKAKKS